MYEQIKTLADKAIALQNKDHMDVALREISAICHEAFADAHLEALANGSAMLATSIDESGEVEYVTYGVVKSFDSEAEMIIDIQGAPSPVFLPPAKKGRAK